MTDYFTKYTEGYALPNKTAQSVADAICERWLPTHGFPQVLHSDQGKEFNNRVILRICELLRCAKTRTTPYHSQSDGLVERFNRTVLTMLAMFVNEEKSDWDDYLPYMILA